MPSLDDLRAAFAELERQAPATLSAPIRPTHRRRWTVIGLAAACTAALAVAIPLLAGNGGGTATPPGGGSHVSGYWSFAPGGGFTSALPAPADGQSPELAFGFAVPGTVAGYTVIPDRITRTYQHASIYGPTEPPGGQLLVFYDGAFDPSSLENRTPVDIPGGTGYYADVRLPGLDHDVNAFAWEYADGGWAVVRLGIDQGDASAKSDDAVARARASAQAAEQSAEAVRNELLLAQAMVPTHDPLRSPLRIPDGSGVHVNGMSVAKAAGGLELSSPGRRWWLGWAPDELRAGDRPNTSTIDIAGRRWIVYRSDGVPRSVGLVADGWGLTVTPEVGTSLETMREFVAALTVAPDPANLDTWFDADANLP